MGAKSLSSRAIIGSLYEALTENTGASWIALVSNYFDSNQDSEEYKWLGMAPAMREWIGGRQAKGLREQGFRITNKDFEATLEVLVREIELDKTGQVMLRIAELSERANSHWAKLLSALIVAGESGVCYDGQYFFDTDHQEGDSGQQSNDLVLDIGTPAAPTAGEMETAVLKSIEAMLGFKDDQGELINDGAKEFTIMVPLPFMTVAAAALGSQLVVEGNAARSNRIVTVGQMGGFTVNMAVNARLPWTTKFATFNTDRKTKAFIRQELEGIKIEAQAEGSPVEFNEKKHLYGVSASRNVGFGYWQRATLTTFT